MKHGTRNAYLQGCRCDECRAASSEYHRAYRYRVRNVGAQYAHRPARQPDSTIPTRPMHLLDVYKPEWVADAACRGATEVFFAERGDNKSVYKAKAICAICPVAEECLQYALDHHERFGIWGGLGPKERRALTNPSRKRAPVAKCGTDSGYYRHRRAGEDACAECRRAHTRVTIDGKRRRRGAA